MSDNYVLLITGGLVLLLNIFGIIKIVKINYLSKFSIGINCLLLFLLPLAWLMVILILYRKDRRPKVNVSSNKKYKQANTNASANGGVGV
jgi:hypothetical protein